MDLAAGCPPPGAGSDEAEAGLDMHPKTPTAVALAAALATSVGCAHRGATSSEVQAVDRCANREAHGEWAASAVTILCAEDFEGIPAVQVEEWFEGRVPGVWVVHGSSGISLLIRGQGSIRGNNEPLYVLDGVPLQMEPGRGLYWVSPRDIATVAILKDASATAIYGVRGANGVVLITTRH